MRGHFSGRALMGWVFGAVALLICSSNAFAQGFSVNITVDENGNGSFTNSNSFNSSLPSGQLQDPGPGGLAGALTYSMLSPPGLTEGDVVIVDGSGNSDLIRFNPTEIAPDQSTGALVFYSVLPGTALADIGLPGPVDTNWVTLNEVDLGGGTLGALYTPTRDQPGFVAGAAGPVNYEFISDPAPVPEPATLTLFGAALAGLGFIRRRR
jgi:hypothetical protein